MQAKACESTSENKIVGQHQHRAGGYRKVFDTRKRRVRGLWKRGDSFYAQLRVADATGKRVARRTRLEDKDGSPVATVAEAIKAMEKLRVKREDQELVLEPKRSPLFREYAETYRDYFRAVATAKSLATVKTESSCINRLVGFFGDTRLREITPALIKSYIVKRSGEDRHAVTLNMVLRKVREKAGMPWFSAHLARHFFASYCVMSGIDYGTLKEWLGHEDTKLIDEVYGHLNREHK